MTMFNAGLSEKSMSLLPGKEGDTSCTINGFVYANYFLPSPRLPLLTQIYQRLPIFLWISPKILETQIVRPWKYTLEI